MVNIQVDQGPLWWLYYGAIGVPFTVFLAVALVLLHALRWRPSRVWRYGVLSTFVGASAFDSPYVVPCFRAAWPRIL